MPDQRSLTDQMLDLRSLAIEKGLYDACDWIERTFFAPVSGASRYAGAMTCWAHKRALKAVMPNAQET